MNAIKRDMEERRDSGSMREKERKGETVGGRERGIKIK